MTVDYDHERNAHTPEGARAALPLLVGQPLPRSLLDVGCGNGTWMRAADDLGIADVRGIDGVKLPAAGLHVPEDRIMVADLSGNWDLHRQFDLVLCLEVAEHLEPAAAGGFIERLTRHGDRILFSAAIPGQTGQHHINCQWPAYWQTLFNRVGFACRDTVRWRIWSNPMVEAWYRQNLFTAEKCPGEAGQEARIPPVVHPDYVPTMLEDWRRARESFVVACLNAWAERWRGWFGPR